MNAHRHDSFERNVDGLCVISLDGIYVDFNAAWERMLGYSREEMLGKSCFDYIHPDDRESVKHLEDHFEDDRLVNYENRYVRKDGSVLRVRWNVVRDVKQGVAYCSAREVANDHELSGRELLDFLSAASQEMITRHKLSGEVIFSSPGCKSLLGYEVKEFIGLDPYKLFHPEDIEDIARNHERVMKGGEASAVRYRYKKKDGDYRLVESCCVAVRDPNSGEPREIICVSRAIDDEK